MRVTCPGPVDTNQPLDPKPTGCTGQPGSRPHGARSEIVLARGHEELDALLNHAVAVASGGTGPRAPPQQEENVRSKAYSPKFWKGVLLPLTIPLPNSC